MINDATVSRKYDRFIRQTLKRTIIILIIILIITIQLQVAGLIVDLRLARTLIV